MVEFDPDRITIYVLRYGGTEQPKSYVLMSDYNALLQLYHEEQVKSANAAFLEQTDAAIIEAEHIKLPEGVKLP